MIEQKHNINAERSLDTVSYNELETKIQRLQHINLLTTSIREVQQMIGSIINQCPLQVRPLALSGVYRARKRTSDEPFHSVQELWYPPASVVHKPGRLNDKGESRFYAADTSNTAILELKPKTGDIITVLAARTKSKPSALLKKVTFIGIERSRSDTIQNLTDEDIFRRSRSFRESLGEDNYKKWLLVDKYLSELLGRAIADSEEHMYKPTIALANLLFGIPNLDAINYPSVVTQDRGINICMTPEKADTYFRPSEAWMIRVVQYDVINDVMLPRCQLFRKSKYIRDDGSIDWLSEGEGIDQYAMSRFFGSTKVETVSILPHSNL